MSPKSNSASASLLDGLLALRDRYIAILNDSENQSNHAKEQLSHLNALLVDQLVVSGAPTDLGVAKLQPAAPAQLPPAPASIPTFIAPPAPKSAAKAAAPVIAAPPKGRKAPGQMSKSSTRETVLPLLPPYGGLTKIQAVQRVMEEHAGKEVHLDDVIHILHGELDKITLRQERGRMRNLMWRGADRKLWDKIRGKDSYYTLKMTLLPGGVASKGTGSGRGRKPASAVAAAPAKVAKAAKVTAPAKAAKAPKAATKVAAPKATKGVRGKAAAKPAPAAKAPRKETPIRLIKAKDKKVVNRASSKAAAASSDLGASLMGSVEQVLRANKGKSMTAEEIATAIFGNLDRNMLTQVKKQISDRLAKGVKYKRWQRVPNKIGSYIYA
jgi:hypothetical protein